MASNDWKSDLNGLLDFIEQQSTISLERISQHFLALGLQFDDDFQQKVRRLVNLR